jgi:hypothetical protein
VRLCEEIGANVARRQGTWLRLSAEKAAKVAAATLGTWVRLCEEIGG